MVKTFKRAPKVCGSLWGTHPVTPAPATRAGLLQRTGCGQGVRQACLCPLCKLLVLHPALVSLDAHICLIAEAQRKPHRGPRGASADGDCPPLPCPDGPCRGLPVSLSLGLTTLQNRRRYCLISPGRKERLSLVRALAQGYITVGEEPGFTESETDPSPASSRAPHPGLVVCVGTRFLKSLRAPTSS